jgi:hypothetical protein
MAVVGLAWGGVVTGEAVGLAGGAPVAVGVAAWLGLVGVCVGVGVTFGARPRTSSGVGWSSESLEPMPSRPAPLFPQHFTLLHAVRAHV